MPPFRDDQIIIIAPGSHTVLAQLGLPESFTPARLRVRSCMFRGPSSGEWEPYKIRQKKADPTSAPEVTSDANGQAEKEDTVTYEEDLESEEGAVWPVQAGKIINWSCFFALMQHVFNALNPPFHTPILLIAQPVWTPREYEKLTQFFFEKFKPPAFSILDAAQAACYGFGVPSALVIDVGADKADVTAVSDFIIQDIGRGIAVPDCGGEVMTAKLLDLLRSKDFTRDMCEQLKMSPICEILPYGTPLPVMKPETLSNDSSWQAEKPAVAIDTQRAFGEATAYGGGQKDDEDNEGVIDVASIVAGGKMNEFLARKEREKAEKAAAKKKGAEAIASARALRMKNADKEFNTFSYEITGTPEPVSKSETNGHDQSTDEKPADDTHEIGGIDTNGAATSSVPASGASRREVTVGTERFLAASGGILDTLATAIHRTVLSVPDPSKRSDLWENIIIVGSGTRIRGFPEALISVLAAKFLISPSSATIFTSELPSNVSTPLPTGANTPQYQPGVPSGHSVNPLLIAATTASIQTPGQQIQPQMSGSYQPQHGLHSSHGQTPTNLKVARLPDYFPEWKEVGNAEAAFLGAQVAAKVLFVTDQAVGKGYMTRPDYNDQGPTGIHDYTL